ncbi:MAG: class I SAM-dependent methyltransferase [Nitrososphaera sp.]
MYLRYRLLLLQTGSKRYANIFRIIYRNRYRRIVEIGTWNGVHAAQMIQTAAVHHLVKDISYFGFDLFEDLTDDELRREFSKRPASYKDVRRRLELTGANIHLYKGNTKVTLPQAIEHIGWADLIFIDGGHSIETITSDWNAVKTIMERNTTVIFDDYYSNKEPEVLGVGCQALIEELDRQLYEVEIVQPTDAFVKEWGILRVNMVYVTMRHRNDGKAF